MSSSVPVHGRRRATDDGPLISISTFHARLGQVWRRSARSSATVDKTRLSKKVGSLDAATGCGLQGLVELFSRRSGSLSPSSRASLERARGAPSSADGPCAVRNARCSVLLNRPARVHVGRRLGHDEHWYENSVFDSPIAARSLSATRAQRVLPEDLGNGAGTPRTSLMRVPRVLQQPLNRAERETAACASRRECGLP